MRSIDPRHALVAACLLVVVGDLGQVLAWGWSPERLPAIAGAALYLGLALAAGAGQRWPAWIALVMPVVPLGNLALWALTGAGATPHAVMFAVLAAQVSAALAASSVLRTEA